MGKNKKRITLRDIWERMATMESRMATKEDLKKMATKKDLKKLEERTNNMEERMDEVGMHMRKLSIEVQAVKQQNSSFFVEPFAKPSYRGTSASGPEIVWD